MNESSLLRSHYHDGKVYVARDRGGKPEHAVYNEETGEFEWCPHPAGGLMQPLVPLVENRERRCRTCFALAASDDYACAECGSDLLRVGEWRA